jgi:TolB-like protein/DNA-binding winged helix-turn-helix (wHTH) protein/Flp pilus assembly protein TadD
LIAGSRPRWPGGPAVGPLPNRHRARLGPTHLIHSSVAADRTASPRFARFGVFELDLRDGTLRKRGARIRLQHQPLTILRLLIERGGGGVTREELRAALWPADTFVDFEHNLNSAVKRLRAALGDSAATPRFIETLPRQGYRWLTPIDLVEDAGDSRPAALPAASSAFPPPTRSRAREMFWPAAVIGAAAIAAAALVVGVRGLRSERAPGVITSLAVLPLQNLSNDPEQAYFVDGLTEALIDNLARIQQLKVISRTSVMTFKDQPRRLPDVARALGVDAVVEGSVLRAGDEVRITVQLIEGRTDRHLWTDSYLGTLGDVIGLQRRVARAIAREIKVRLTSPEEARLTTAPKVDPAAQESYLKGRYFWNLRTPDGIARAIQHFEAALKQDPGNAQAMAGLADAYNLLPRYGPASTRAALLRAKEYALSALEIDPDLAEAHAALAKVRHSLDWNWAGAEESFRRAISLSPGYATAHHWYSIYLLTVGRVDQGVREALRARELDPLSRVINLHVGWSYFLAGQAEQALGQVQRTLELAPDYGNAHNLLGWIHLRNDRVDAARQALRRAVELDGSQPEYVAALAVVEARSGRPAEMRRLLASLSPAAADPELSAQPLVWIRTALGDRDEALRLAARDVENRSVCFYLFHLRLHPFFEPLRADPRLRELFKAVGLRVNATSSSN